MPSQLRRSASATVAATAALVAGLVPAVVTAVPAAAAPPPPAYGSGATTTILRGRAFDSCTAPDAAHRRAWRRASTFHGFGLYVSGRNRACVRQPLLGPSYLRSAARSGWRVIPIHVGRQATCSSLRFAKINRFRAYAQGRQEADEAARAVRALGMLSGTTIYYDLEGYPTTSRSCRVAVLRMVDGWVDRLHERSMLAGVYSGAASGLRDLAQARHDPIHSRVDAIWNANWNGRPSVHGDHFISDGLWRVHQRMHQYRGDHVETHGGVRHAIDSNAADAVVASLRYRYTSSAHGGLAIRTQPTTHSRRLGTIGYVRRVEISCQARGMYVAGTRVWNRLTTGGWVSDGHVTTPGRTAFSAPIPRCSVAFQVRRPVFLRPAPTLAAARAGSLGRGSLAFVVCQRRGSRAWGSRVWDRLLDGRWVPDAYLRSRSRTSYSNPAARCS